MSRGCSYRKTVMCEAHCRSVGALSPLTHALLLQRHPLLDDLRSATWSALAAKDQTNRPLAWFWACERLATSSLCRAVRLGPLVIPFEARQAPPGGEAADAGGRRAHPGPYTRRVGGSARHWLPLSRHQVHQHHDRRFKRNGNYLPTGLRKPRVQASPSRF